ncbi:hypothetical protein GH733_014080, partial [Mirounga leonina]
MVGAGEEERPLVYKMSKVSMCCGTMHSRKVPAPGEGSHHLEQGYSDHSSLEEGCHLALLSTREVGRDPAGPWGWHPRPRRSVHQQRQETLGTGPSAGGPAGSRQRGELSGSRAPRQLTAPPPLVPSRTRGSKHLDVIRARLCLSPPISPDRWTCSPPLRARSMSRFPAVAGRAPRRQEEGERSIDLQQDRPSALSIADKGAVRGTLRRPAGVSAWGFWGDKSPLLAGREKWRGDRSVLLALQAGGELCGASFQEPVSMVTHHLAFWDISHSEQGPNLNHESEANTEEKGCTSQEGGTTPTFPIQKQRKKLIQAVRDNSFLIVTGNTGSGKTTQLPKYLYEAGFSQHGMIGVTQPRKVAAISVAQRVAEEMKCTLGSRVGYQVRFDDCSSKETAIKYMTDGCLLKHILGDPNLTKFSVIILDEAHERTLTTDILFGLLKKLFQEKSPNRKEHLKVVVMSATMELAKLSTFFGNCPIFDIPGRLYPVREKFCNLIGPRDRENTAYIQAIVKVTMDIHLNEMAGDILVFLTGQFEIEKSCELLFQMAESVDYDYDVQDTTLDGLYVVDGGFVKQLNHNPRLGLDILEVVPISKSEALQRSGRAGRTSSGKCFRIYSKEFWNQCMPDHVIPEIKRTSLTSVVLTLKCLAIHDVIRFPYLDPPNERLILEALKQLYQCDAIDRSGHVTRLGLSMVEFPLPPHLTCAVIKAASLDCEDLLLPIAAIFWRGRVREKEQNNVICSLDFENNGGRDKEKVATWDGHPGKRYALYIFK